LQSSSQYDMRGLASINSEKQEKEKEETELRNQVAALVRQVDEHKQKYFDTLQSWMIRN
jgi:hypothetical protein